MKKTRFLNLIQTHAVAYASMMIRSKSKENNLLYLDGLDQMQTIPDEYIPDDYLYAAKEFIDFWFPKNGQIDIRKKPQWLIDYETYCINMSFEKNDKAIHMFVFSETQFRESIKIGQFKRKFVKLSNTEDVFEYTTYLPSDTSFKEWNEIQVYKDYVRVGYGTHDHIELLTSQQVVNILLDFLCKYGDVSDEEKTIIRGNSANL